MQSPSLLEAFAQVPDPRDPRRMLALAGLTPGIEDDLAALQAQLEDYSAALTGEQAGKNRRDFVIGLADAIAGVKSQIASLRPDTSADTQALLDQQSRRADVAQRAADINAGFLQTLLGAGDLGLSGFRTAPPPPSITIQTLHPGDPATLRAIGIAAVGGFSQQAYRPQKAVSF